MTHEKVITMSLDPIEKADADSLRALPLERTQWSLRHAYENAPHYRKD